MIFGEPTVVGSPTTKDTEPCRCVVANRDDGTGIVLWTNNYVMAEEVSCCSPVLSDLGLDDAPVGISIWEGRVVSRQVGNPFDGYEYDTELEGTFRRPNDHEWTSIMEGKSPWPDEDDEVPEEPPQGAIVLPTGSPPDWFAKAMTEALKTDFENHVDGCEVCKASTSPKEICQSGQYWVKALGLTVKETETK